MLHHSFKLALLQRLVVSAVLSTILFPRRDDEGAAIALRHPNFRV